MMNEYQDIINKELEHIFGVLKTQVKNRNMPNILYKAMHYAVFNGGKRIRPILCIASYKACHPKINNRHLSAILPFACGIELIHTFSLVQDDLPCMDDDDFRRGKPSLHRVFGEDIALLAADGLFAQAFGLFTEAPVDQKRKIQAIAELSRICGPVGLVAGQVLDVSNKNQKTIGKIKNQIDEKKTAELIAGSLKIGAIVAGTRESVRDKLYKAGIYLGLLFQTTDDILDEKKNILDTQRKLFNQAAKYSNRAKTIFNMLGTRFDMFNKFTDYILTRKT
jgi:geranylgeranyl diphosphate synthase, type II